MWIGVTKFLEQLCRGKRHLFFDFDNLTCYWGTKDFHLRIEIFIVNILNVVYS